MIRVFGTDTPYVKANGLLRNCTSKDFNEQLDLLLEELEDQRIKHEEIVYREMAIIKQQAEFHSKLLKETREIQKELQEKQREIATLLLEIYNLPRDDQEDLKENLESIKYLFENIKTIKSDIVI